MDKIPLPVDYIYEFQGDTELTSAYLQESLAKVTFEKTYFDRAESAGYGHPIVKNQQLFDWMTSCVSQVASKYFDLSNNVTLEICDAWMTKSEFMTVGTPHHHSMSILSGLLYLQDSDVPTIFYVESGISKHYENFYDQRFKKSAQVNTITILPKLGKLVIWPSYYKHTIAPNKNKSVRYTLAFNTFFNGVVGDQRSGRLTVNLQGPNFL